MDNTLDYLREQTQIPNIIHSHYADAGYVGIRISNLMGAPLAFTGHSLGRVKRQRLLASGMNRSDIERQYNISRRIDAEEDTLSQAELVVTSTMNEIDDQYELYDHYQPDKMRVIPPGIDLSRFQPPQEDPWTIISAQKIKNFLKDCSKPILLAISRADARKNIAGLLQTYGESSDLQQKSNLVIIAGNRKDIRELDSGAKSVLNEILYLIDLYDLYGKVAYPKSHLPEEVPQFYKLAAYSKGVFINPALTEPFGLTILEAAASGLPVVATEDGGPIDIVNNCKNGLLVNPLETDSMAIAILEMLSDEVSWGKYSENGIKGVHAHYSWNAHTKKYVEIIESIRHRFEGPPVAPKIKQPIRYHDRAIFTDLDQSLLGDADALKEFIKLIRKHRKQAAFGVATGRRLDSALRVIKQYGIPQPDVLITSVGTEIHYAPGLTKDVCWEQHIDYMWNRNKAQKLLSEIPGLFLQSKIEQSKYKISYTIDSHIAPSQDEINSLFRQADLSANIFISFGQYLDIIPVRASKGFALRYISDQWEFPMNQILVAGGSGTDEDMLRGNTLSVVVSNRHEEELSDLSEIETIYFASKAYAAGILEAINYYDFFSNADDHIRLSKVISMIDHLLVCTDLDRTLLPNGLQPESPSVRNKFSILIAKPEISLAYVTGRNKQLITDVIEEYEIPFPDFVIEDMGTSIYSVT
ncbi:MAG: HAD-IIB family hydrolase, partial [Gammaproteobacteria bacterium]